MTDTTTIEITKEQKAALDDHKASAHEPYKSVIGRLLDAPDDERVLSPEDVDALVEEIAVAVEPERGMIDDDQIARQVAAQVDYAELATKVADEVEGRMR